MGLVRQAINFFKFIKNYPIKGKTIIKIHKKNNEDKLFIIKRLFCFFGYNFLIIKIPKYDKCGVVYKLEYLKELMNEYSIIINLKDLNNNESICGGLNLLNTSLEKYVREVIVCSKKYPNKRISPEKLYVDQNTK
jgi:hypothetical protein